MRYLRLYAHFMRFSFSRAMEFRLDFFFRIFMDTLWYAHHLVFFWVVYRHTSLLGGWTLVRETGQIGGRSQLKREQDLDQASAQAAFEHARDLQLKKGFQLMFAQGAEAPR